MNKLSNTNATEHNLFNNIAGLIEQSKKQVVAQANSTLTLLFWQVGYQINEFVLAHKRAEYGKQIVSTLSSQLVEKYGNNFTEKNVRRMIQFAEVYSDVQIVVSLTRQLSWTHITALIPLKSEEQRNFYAQKIADEKWSTRHTRNQIETKVYERTLVANTQLPT